MESIQDIAKENIRFYIKISVVYLLYRNKYFRIESIKNQNYIIHKMITLSGLRDTNEEEVLLIKDTANKFHEKIIKWIADVSLHVDCKYAEKAGEKARFTFIIRVESPKTHFSVEAEEYELKKALNNAFKHAENKIKHELKLEGRDETSNTREKRS